MKLYGSLTSPYVRKLRVLMMEKSIDCQFVVANPADADGLVPSLNPLGKVPVMELDDKEIVYESTLLVGYLDGLKGEPLVPAKGRARVQALRWHALGQGILDAVITRMKEGRRPADKQMASVTAGQEEKVARALQYAEKAEKGASYLVDNRFSIADICLVVALEYVDFRYPHDWRGQYPVLAKWHAAIGSRPSFAATRPPAS